MGFWKWFWLWISLVALIATTLLQQRVANGDTVASTQGSDALSGGSSPPSSERPPSYAGASGSGVVADFANLSRPGYSLEVDSAIAAPWYGGADTWGEPTFVSAEIGDVTGDGRRDLVAVGYGLTPGGQGEVLVYAQKTNGTLGLKSRSPIGVDSAFLTTLGDFNEDGVSDVLVTGMKDFVLFASDSSGGFKRSIHAIYDPVELMAVTPALPIDVNIDGHLDLVFFLTRTHAGSSGFPTSETHSRLVVWFGDGMGSFAGRYSAKTYGTSPYDVEVPVSVASGDLNQDGSQDVAMHVVQYDYGLQIQRNLVRVYLNNGQGQLVSAYDINAVMETGGNLSMMKHIAIGDFNHDGRNDLAGASGTMDQRLWILPQSPRQRFDLPPLVRETEPIGVALEVADLDGNGDDDLLVLHDAWARTTRYMQSGGVLSEPTMREFLYGAAPHIEQSGLAVGDLDGDDCVDAAIAASYYGMYLLRGSCPRSALVCRTQRPTSVSTASSPVLGASAHFDRRVDVRHDLVPRSLRRAQ